MKDGKHTAEHVLHLIKERASIEEEYAKRLQKLSKTFNPKEEIGTMRVALDTVKQELEKSARAHLELAQDLRVKLERPMVNFMGNQAVVRKSHQKSLEKQLQMKAAQEQLVIRAREKYESKQIEKHAMRSLPQTEQNIRKAEKVHHQAQLSDQEYMSSCDRLAEIQAKWEADMTDYQKLEQDRFQFLRTHLWNLTNFISGACVLDDESCERTRCALEKCDFQLDLSAFIELRATGTQIPPPLAYVPFSSNISISQSSLSNDSRIVVNDMAIQRQPSDYYDRKDRAQMSDHTPIVCTGNPINEYVFSTTTSHKHLRNSISKKDK